MLTVLCNLYLHDIIKSGTSEWESLGFDADMSNGNFTSTFMFADDKFTV